MPMILNHLKRRTQYGFGRSIIAAQCNFSAGRIILFKSLKQGDIRTSESVDGLIRIADHAQIPHGFCIRCQCANDTILSLIQVLIFININMLVLLPIFAALIGLGFQ